MSLQKVNTAFLLIFIFPIVILSHPDSLSVRQNLEPLLEDVTIDNENEFVMDMIEYLSDNPVKINFASLDELLSIPFMDYNSASLIIEFRKKSSLVSFDQLKNIEGITVDLIDKITPYITFASSNSNSPLKKSSDDYKQINFSYRTREQLEIQDNAGTLSGKYTGSPWKSYNRFKFVQKDQFEIGVLTEKDPGEKYIYDFVTAHVQIKNWSLIENMILGDYKIEFAEGLAIWSKYKISKTNNAVDYSSGSKFGAIPSLSSDETNFLRGIALTFENLPFTLTTFYSYRFLDASVDSLTSQITSFNSTGLHRTITEQNKKYNITEKVIGSVLDYSFGSSGSIGFLIFNSKFSNNFNVNSPLYPGENGFNYLSLGYSFHFPGINLHGENASNLKNISSISNIEFIINNNLSLLISYRNYPLKYWDSHSQGFGERSSAQNETGFYLGLKYNTGFGTINFYYDQYKLFMASQYYQLPSSNNELLIFYTVNPFTDIRCDINYTLENKEYPDIIGNSYGLITKIINKLKIDLNYRFSKKIDCKSRFEFVDVTPTGNSGQDRGFLLYQDINFNISKDFSCDSRIIIFQTDTYNSRIYEYENDLPGSLSNPSLYGEGIRWYILLRFSKLANLTFSLKYSELYKPFEKSLGTGNDEIFNNLNNVLSFQIEYNL